MSGTQDVIKTSSVSALSNSSHDSGSTPSSKDTSQYPSTLTLSTVAAESNLCCGLPLQEPDVIASTKSANSKVKVAAKSDGPVAPPRRKKKAQNPTALSLSVSF